MKRCAECHAHVPEDQVAHHDARCPGDVESIEDYDRLMAERDVNERADEFRRESERAARRARA